MDSGAADVDHVQAGYWSSRSALQVAEIESKHFTHLYAGFAVVDRFTGGVTFPSASEEAFQTFTEEVRKKSSKVKTLLSIGGEGSDIAPVVRDANKRAKFIKDSIALATGFQFDGLDLCWLYPSPSDNDADLGSFLKEWHDAVKKDAQKRKSDQLLLTAAVYYGPEVPDHNGRSFQYPYNAISAYLNWINVLAIDFYTPQYSSTETGPVHGWHTRSTDPNKCGSAGIAYWIKKNVRTKQLVLGLPFHGYEWILENSNNTGFFSAAHPANNFSLSYKTIMKNIIPRNYETIHDIDYSATYSYNKQKSWVGYDDEFSITAKVKEARKATLGGYFAWDVGADDDKWTLSTAAKKAWDPPAGANP